MFDVPSQYISADLLRLCKHIQVLSSDVHPCLDYIKDYPLPESRSFQLESNDCYNRFSRRVGRTVSFRDDFTRTPVYEGSFIRQIQSLSVNTASVSAQHLLSQVLPNVSMLQIQVSRNADLLLRFLSLNPPITVLSIQHTAPHTDRVDEWSTFTDALGTALHHLPNLSALQLEIDDEDLNPSFITVLSTLPHLKKLSLGEEQQIAISQALAHWPATAGSESDAPFLALEHLVLDVKKYTYLDKQSAKSRPSFDKLTKRNLDESRYHDWMRQQAQGWAKRCPKLKWMLMYRLYFGGLAFSFEEEGRRARAVMVPGRRPYDELDSTFLCGPRMGRGVKRIDYGL